MLTLKEKLGRQIKKLRKQAGLSQEKLAETLDMDIPNLSNIERGKRFMTAETLEKIALALNTTERELFDFREISPQKYFRGDIENLLDLLDCEDLEFILNVLQSYKNLKTKKEYNK